MTQYQTHEYDVLVIGAGGAAPSFIKVERWGTTSKSGGVTVHISVTPTGVGTYQGTVTFKIRDHYRWRIPVTVIGTEVK